MGPILHSVMILWQVSPRRAPKKAMPAQTSTEPMACICVDGIDWELRFDADGVLHWEAAGVTEEQKQAAAVDLTFSQPGTMRRPCSERRSKLVHPRRGPPPPPWRAREFAISSHWGFSPAGISRNFRRCCDAQL